MAIQGCAAVVSMDGSEDAVIVGFTASDVAWQRVNSGKLDYWLSSAILPDVEFDSVTVSLDAGQELVIHGLGSVAMRRQRTKLRLHKPKGVRFTVRPNLVGGKQHG